MSLLRKLKFAGYFGLIILFLFSLDGCQMIRKTVGRKKALSEEESLVRKVVNAQPDWKFVEIRLSGKADDNDRKIGFIGTVKMQRDRQIYLILRSTIGIEVARLYANQDSVWMISKMLNIKEKGDWKLISARLGYPVDFYAMQGIFVQSLYTSVGNQLEDLVKNLIVKTDKDMLRLVSNQDVNSEDRTTRYCNDFTISPEYYTILGAKIRDIKGQWIVDVKYQYNKENLIKKIELLGIDSEKNFGIEANVVKMDIKDYIEINFDKF